LAVGDLDRDGRQDMVINNLDAKPAVLRNVASQTGHWLALRLIADGTKNPKDGIGSVVYLTTGKVRQRRDVISGAVYCSQNDLVLHFGLGAATKVDKLEIQWPDGTLELIQVPAIDKTVTIIQGKGSQK
jgi:hypothetical protein